MPPTPPGPPTPNYDSTELPAGDEPTAPFEVGSFYLRSRRSGEIMALVSPHHDAGVAVPVYRDAANALARAAAHYPDVAGDYVAIGIIHPWSWAIKVADLGFAGITLDEEHPLYFFVRREDASHDLPTLVGAPVGGEWRFVNGGGQAAAAADNLLPWRDFRRLDPLTRRWMGDGPFPGYRDDLFLYELRTAGAVVIAPRGARLLGPHVSDQGAVTLYADAEIARAVADRPAVLGGHRLATFDPAKRQLSVREPDPDATLEVAVAEDVPARLDHHLAEHGPFLDVGLSSADHRSRQGYFFRGADAWYLRTITGIWRVTPPFRLTRVAKPSPPKADTVDGG